MTKPFDEIEGMFWCETSASGQSKAIGHAWVEFKECPAGLMIKVNEVPAYRISIKYRESGPYLAVEVAPGTGETMGSCVRTAAMVKHYAEILESHNELGEKLHSARSFVISEDERALVKMSD